MKTASNYSLSKIIPSRTKTISFSTIVKDFTVMGATYRAIRGKMRNKMMSCFWCGHDFIDGESIALGFATKGGNKVLCNTCADSASQSAKQHTGV